MSTQAGFATFFLVSLFMAGIAAAADDWAAYQPGHALGTDKNDWWVRYPDQNVNAGLAVGHPSWVLEDLKSGPVLILDRSNRCRPCLRQLADVKKVLANTSLNVTYYDLNAESSDRRAEEIMSTYSPVGGGQSLVPLTVIVTLIEDEGGRPRVAWHSAFGNLVDAEGNDLGEIWLRSYLQDAIYYYRQNTDSAQQSPALFSGIQESERMQRLKKATSDLWA
jgi:hypothetical protein